MKIIIAILSVAVLTGCHSVGLRKSNETYGTVYLATARDASLLTALASSNSEEQGVGVLGAMSLPFDLVVDTVCLPYDVYNIRKSSEFDSYGISCFREYQLDSKNRLCRSVRYQMETYPFSMSLGSHNSRHLFSGHVNTKDGVLDGESKMWSHEDRVYLIGEYKDGAPWNGTILLGAAKPGEMMVGPLNTYENGVLINSSNLVVNLDTVK